MSEDNKTGYRKPPKDSQFKPGQSGNPRGRPKGARGIKTDLAAELSATWTTSINGNAMKGTKQRLMFRTLTARAATGDVKAAAILLPLILQVLGIEDRGGDRERLSPQDQALLEELLGGADNPNSDAMSNDGRDAAGHNEDEGRSDDQPGIEDACDD